MNSKYELLDESSMDIEDFQVERDAQLAAVDAIRRARSCGTHYVISESGKGKLIPGNESGPYEEQLLASAAKLEERIAELQMSGGLLNDKPSPKGQ